MTKSERIEYLRLELESAEAERDRLREELGLAWQTVHYAKAVITEGLSCTPQTKSRVLCLLDAALTQKGAEQQP